MKKLIFNLKNGNEGSIFARQKKYFFAISIFFSNLIKIKFSLGCRFIASLSLVWVKTVYIV